MKKNKHYEELDLYEMFFDLWKNKFKILIITTVFFILGLIYNFFTVKSYTAITNIKPISTFENQKYQEFNSVANIDEDTLVENDLVNIVNINSNYLFHLFISKIQTEEIIEKGIIKFKLIDKNNFNNEKNYNEAVKRKAILIIDQMSPPNKDKKNISYWQYNFEIINKAKWRNFLEYIQKQANNEIRQSIINQFDIEVNILKNNSKFQLEDIDQKIANALDDYKTSIFDRLVFLKEQALLARDLNIETNQFETNTNKNIKSENSYYLKGYKMIEKEISLINSRENETAFIDGLSKLKQKKRSILQDKKIERIKLLFSKTPITNKDNFIAGKVDYVATIYKSEKSTQKILSTSLVIGLLISFIYLVLDKVVALRK
tara:strand:+ start:403 stop:1524 length:1122 start_codon:yes stop_codon:yes gene_type:complete